MDFLSSFSNCSWDNVLETKATCLPKPQLESTPPKINANPIKYIPGKVFFLKDVDSVLTKRQQAICLKGLQLLQSGRNADSLSKEEKYFIDEYHNHHGQIHEENLKFLNYVREDWKTRWSRADQIKPTLYKYAKVAWNRKLLKVLAYPQLYKQFSTIALSSQENEQNVKVMHLQEVMRYGDVARFEPPSMILKYEIPVISLPQQEILPVCNSKLPVSRDANVRDILESHNVDLVISSSALKTLADNSDYKMPWDIPVLVESCNQKQADGTHIAKNVIFIDKTLPKRKPTNADFNEYCHKKLVRSNFCIDPEICYPVPEAEIAETNSEPEAAASSPPTGDPRGRIFHNVSYDIWKMNVNDERSHLMKTRICGREIRLLVRCKVDACERLENLQMRPVIVLPKLEYQIEHGANIATKSELNRQWISLFIRPFSHLYRVRVQSNTSEVVSVEGVSMQKINFEATSFFNSKPSLGLDVLYTILSELLKLKPGQYLLHHLAKDGSFVQILKAEGAEINKSDTTNYFDLHAEYSEANCRDVPISDTWCPINVNYVLPVHTTFKRMPGMFKPLIITPQMIKQRKNATKNQKRRDKKAKAKKVDLDSPEWLC